MSRSINISLRVNSEDVRATVPSRLNLVDFLREELSWTGSHVGCEHGVCGACTITVDGETVRGCLMLAAQADGKEITTIEGLSADSDTLHPLQAAWIQHQVPQCGYCQSGQLMSAASLLATNADPSDDDINAAMAGNICRCGMYGRIKSAIKTAASSDFYNAAEVTGE